MQTEVDFCSAWPAKLGGASTVRAAGRAAARPTPGFSCRQGRLTVPAPAGARHDDSEDRMNIRCRASGREVSEKGDQPCDYQRQHSR